MKTTTISYEYDEEGRVTKETRVEFDTPIPSAPAASCVCFQPWQSTSPRHCPVHGTTPTCISGGTVGTADPSLILRNVLSSTHV